MINRTYLDERESFIRELIENGEEIDKQLLADLFNCKPSNIATVIYRIKNPGYWRKYSARNQVNSQNDRAKKLLCKGKLTVDEWNRLCEKYGHRCLRCQKEGKLVIDHVIPLSKGGTNTIDNIQPLCAYCNAKKNAKLLEDHRPVDRAYKRMAIATILRDEVKGQWSDREIAREVGCSHATVAKVRKGMVAGAEIPHLPERIFFYKGKKRRCKT